MRSLTEFNRRAQRFVNVEEVRSALNMISQPITTTTNVNSTSTSASPTTSKPHGDNPSKRKKKNEGNNPEAEGGKKKKGERYFSVYKVYTELNESRENIYLANENQVPFRRSNPMRNQKAKRNSSKYCRFHRDIGHTTDECRQLKDKIEGLISRGYFKQYVRNQNPNQASTSQKAVAAPPAQNNYSRAREDERPPPIDGEDVITISGGPHIGGLSWNAHK